MRMPGRVATHQELGRGSLSHHVRTCIRQIAVEVCSGMNMVTRASRAAPREMSWGQDVHMLLLNPGYPRNPLLCLLQQAYSRKQELQPAAC